MFPKTECERVDTFSDFNGLNVYHMANLLPQTQLEDNCRDFEYINSDEAFTHDDGRKGIFERRVDLSVKPPLKRAYLAG